jgi:hypothetical protein
MAGIVKGIRYPWTKNEAKLTSGCSLETGGLAGNRGVRTLQARAAADCHNNWIGAMNQLRRHILLYMLSFR